MPRKARLKPISQQVVGEPTGEAVVTSEAPTHKVAQLVVYYRHLNTVNKEVEVHSITWRFPSAKQMGMVERAILHAEMINRDGLRVDTSEGTILWYPPERIVQMLITIESVLDEEATLSS